MYGGLVLRVASLMTGSCLPSKAGISCVPDRFQSDYPDVIRKYANTVRKPGWKRRTRQFAMRYPVVMYPLIGSMAFLSVILIHNILRQIKVDDHLKADINGTTFIAAVTVFIAAYQLWLNSMTAQANTIRDFFVKFFEKDEFFRTWFSLIYAYENLVFQQIDGLVKAQQITCIEDLGKYNKGREEGFRLWHPNFLGGTEEESKLDNLFGLMNILGDHYDRGNLSLNEIGDAAEYYLAAISGSEVVRSYFDSIMSDFLNPISYKDGQVDHSPQRLRYGYPPFRHLCLLLYDLDRRRQRRERKINDLLSEQ